MKKKQKTNCILCGQETTFVEGVVDMTATAAQLRRDAEYKSGMDYKMAKALLTGQIDSQVIRWAEQLMYVFEKLK